MMITSVICAGGLSIRSNALQLMIQGGNGDLVGEAKFDEIASASSHDSNDHPFLPNPPVVGA